MRMLAKVGSGTLPLPGGRHCAAHGLKGGSGKHLAEKISMI